MGRSAVSRRVSRRSSRGRVIPSPRRIIWAGLLALLAVNSRLSVGLGPVIALALLGVASLFRAAVGPRASDRRIHRVVRAIGSLAPGNPEVARRTGALLLLTGNERSLGATGQ